MEKTRKTREVCSEKQREAEVHEKTPIQISYNLGSPEEYIGHFIFELNATFLRHPPAPGKNKKPQSHSESFYLQVFKDRSLAARLYRKTYDTRIEEENLLQEFILDDAVPFQDNIHGMLLFISR